MTGSDERTRRSLYEDSRSAYDSAAERYGLSDGVEVVDESLLSAFAYRLAPAATVLDLGSGPGQYAHALTRAGHRVVAVDNSLPMLVELRRRGGRDRGAAVQMDLRQLGFREASFDAVWAAASLIHVIDQEILATLAGIHRVVRPNGLVMVNFAVSDKGLRFERLSADEYRESGRFFQHYSTAAQLEQLIERSGFEALDRVNRTVEPPLGDGSEIGRINWVSFICARRA